MGLIKPVSFVLLCACVACCCAADVAASLQPADSVLACLVPQGRVWETAAALPAEASMCAACHQSVLLETWVATMLLQPGTDCPFMCWPLHAGPAPHLVPLSVHSCVVQEVSGWINEVATVPVWAKMTPNITDITQPARTALQHGCEGLAAINTIQSVMGVNLETLRPEPSVEGYSTPGGYSSKAVKPIALAKASCKCRGCLPTWLSMCYGSGGARMRASEC